MHDAHAGFEDLLEHADEHEIVVAKAQPADRDAEDQREHHERQHLAVERANGRVERVAGNQFDEGVAEGFCRGGVCLQRRDSWQLRPGGERHPRARLEQVHQCHAHDDRRGAQQQREHECPSRHA